MRGLTVVFYPEIFHTYDDEEALFKWLRRLRQVKSYQGTSRGLEVKLARHPLTYSTIRNLVGICARYRYDQRQLGALVEESNSAWLEPLGGSCDVKQAELAPLRPVRARSVSLSCAPLQFYSWDDHYVFCWWLRKVGCITKVEWQSGGLLLHLSAPRIPRRDLMNLVAIFRRYGFAERPLQVFSDESTRDLLEWNDGQVRQSALEILAPGE